MTSGIASKGVDLDSIFDPWLSGTSKARATVISIAGSDLNNRFAPLIYGSSAAATGIYSESADLNTLFAAKGTAQYTTPDNGVLYSSSRTVTIGGSGVASVALLMTKTQYEVQVATNSGSTTYGPFAIPAGMTQFYTGLVRTSAPDSHYSQSVLYSSVWTNLSVLSASSYTQLAVASITINNAVQGQDDTGTATLTLRFGTSGTPVFSGTNGWTMRVRNTT